MVGEKIDIISIFYLEFFVVAAGVAGAGIGVAGADTKVERFADSFAGSL